MVQGFLPESLDQFAQDYVLPAFTPTLGVFLAISTLYGLWKVGGRARPHNRASVVHKRFIAVTGRCNHSDVPSLLQTRAAPEEQK
jgi:hypothetical protein